jgi:hypothetical protein
MEVSLGEAQVPPNVLSKNMNLNSADQPIGEEDLV